MGIEFGIVLRTYLADRTDRNRDVNLKAIQAFLFAKEIQGLSPNTLRNYRLTLARFQAFFDGEYPALKNITAKEILAFLHLLRTKIYNGDLRDKFCEWYPDMSQSTENLPLAI